MPKKKSTKKTSILKMTKMLGTAEIPLEKETREFYKGLSKSKKQAIRYYSGEGYKPINAVLSNLKPRKETGAFKASKRLHDLFTEAPKTSSDITVYRGIAVATPNMPEAITDLYRQSDAGTLLETRRFSSTSVDPSVARNFAFQGPEPYFMSITIPPGVPGIYIEAANPAYPGEKEILLDAGTGIVVTKRTDHPDYVHLEAVCQYCTPETLFPQTPNPFTKEVGKILKKKAPKSRSSIGKKKKTVTKKKKKISTPKKKTVTKKKKTKKTSKKKASGAKAKKLKK